MHPLAAVLAAAAISVPSAAAAQSVLYKAEPHYQPAAKSAGDPAPRRRAVSPATVELPMPTAAEQAAAPAGGAAGTRQIGYGRALPQLKTEGRLHSRLRWRELDGGRRVAAVRVASHGAAALRLGVYVSALPLEARIRFAAPSGGEVFEFTGEQILEVVADNLEAGDTTAEGRTFWSPVIESHAAVMELELPPGVPPEHLRIGVPRLSHLVGSAGNGFREASAKSSCQIDVSCHAAKWAPESNAVARMVYTVDGATYACSGTLLADQDPSTHIPYFQTAQHCIPDQTTASTVVTYWFYRSASCRGAEPARHKVLGGGARLLHADRESDVALLRLNATPPAGALFAGWMAGAPIPTGSNVTGIHHPTGDLQKISFGEITSYVSCLSSTAESLLCSHAFVPDARFYGVSWRGGVTGAGSSGSGLFLDEGRYLVGQLFAGASSCDAKSGGDYYARFDLAYRRALSRWLGTAATRVAAPPPLQLRLSTTLSVGRLSPLRH